MRSWRSLARVDDRRGEAISYRVPNLQKVTNAMGWTTRWSIGLSAKPVGRVAGADGRSRKSRCPRADSCTVGSARERSLNSAARASRR